jgi:hypothetical protein
VTADLLWISGSLLHDSPEYRFSIAMGRKISLGFHREEGIFTITVRVKYQKMTGTAMSNFY